MLSVGRIIFGFLRGGVLFLVTGLLWILDSCQRHARMAKCRYPKHACLVPCATNGIVALRIFKNNNSRKPTAVTPITDNARNNSSDNNFDNFDENTIDFDKNSNQEDRGNCGIISYNCNMKQDNFFALLLFLLALFNFIRSQ